MTTKLIQLAVTAMICAVVPSCSSTFNPRACATDGDCGSNACELRDGKPVCVDPTTASLHIGMSAPISGPSQSLGTEMKRGVVLAFDEQNDAGGVHGRKLVLDFRDDQYQPDLAEASARALVDVQATKDPPRCPTTTTPAVAGQNPISTTALNRGPNAVLAFLGNVGTPTMVRAAPVSLETGTVFFGAFTGATPILRDMLAGPCAKYVFNVRASYANEARATLEYFFRVKVPDYTHLLSFDQNDSFGQAGYSGLTAAYIAMKGAFPANADPTTPIPRFRYERGDDSTVAAPAAAAEVYIAGLLGADASPHTVGIMMTDTYGPAATFITALRQWQFANDSQQMTLQKATRLKVYFSNVSFVGPNALAQRLVDAGQYTTPTGPQAYTTNVIVSQVVPNYQSDSSDVVVSYRQKIAAAGAQPTFTSLEGYVAARVFVAGLLAHQGPFTPESLVATFENLPDLSLGLGASSRFAAGNHNYSKSVWGTSIESDGTFSNVYFWSDGLPIQFFE
jgi:ABC-type branched-subunit amino acid transport system substrate-binding protein